MSIKFGDLSDAGKAEVFIAWTKGKVIQCKRHSDKEWTNLFMCPNWYADNQYRIKPGEPINSIDWSLIRPDYNYLAKDECGNWFLYKKKPLLDEMGWTGDFNGIATLDLGVFTFFNPKPIDWKDSLISRPNIT